MVRIAISAGHGPSTPGKRTPDGFREFQFNRPTADYLANYLSEYENVSILKVYNSGRDMPLAERVKMANDWKADFYISIHFNAAGPGGWYDAAEGIETLVYSLAKGSNNGYDAGKMVQNELISHTGRKSRGVKARPDLYELRASYMPAALAENGFMTHRAEAALMKQSSYQQKCARAICDGLVDYFNLKKKSSTSPVIKPSQPTTIYKVQVGAFGSAKNAANLVNELKKDGFDAYYFTENGLHKVQSGAFSVYKNAQNRVQELKNKGYKGAWITQ